MSILEKIYNSVLIFSAQLTTEETLETIVKEAAKLVGGEHGSIYLADNGNLKRVYASSPSFYKYKEIPRNGHRYGVFTKQVPLVLNFKEVKKLEKRYPPLKDFASRSVLLIPLSYQKQSVGLLSIMSFKDKIFSGKELEILKLFGGLASLAIRKAQLYSETKNALDTRDLFISLAAHELRTPLTTINGYVQLLLSKLRDNKQIQSRWVMELALESQRLQSLINEFLEINRIRSGKIQYDWEEIKVRELAQRSIGSFHFNNPTRRLIFKDKIPSKNDVIIGDFDKLFQVLNNILENAEKYSPENKKIFLTLKFDSPYFVLGVKDQGQGIVEKDLPLIFRGFYKGKNSLHEGMGLGLYLAKNIIDSHHGEIDIKSKIGKGTTVQIKLPKIEK